MSGASSEQARVIETLNCIIDVERAKGLDEETGHG